MGIVERKYLYEFDDPYKILAYHIIGTYRPVDVLNVLADNSAIKNRVLKETRLQDIGGFYLDCIIEDILDQKDRMEYMHQLDNLGLYFYTKLDKARLRKEILDALNKLGIEFSATYSTAGKVSSAST